MFLPVLKSLIPNTPKRSMSRSQKQENCFKCIRLSYLRICVDKLLLLWHSACFLVALLCPPNIITCTLLLKILPRSGLMSFNLELVVFLKETFEMLLYVLCLFKDIC